MTQDEPTWPVSLYVYDLSQGLARQLSMALTGRQLDGIWHTSIVAWDREYFFGQGVSTVSPGTSHHGAPLETHQLGETHIDRDTFEQLLLEDLKPRFRAQDYNLLSWNCNNFTQEFAQLLTGNDIPDHIRSLPADFLSTPFGQMMKPRIEAMFRGPDASTTIGAAAGSAPLPANSLLYQVASRAYAGNEPMQASEGATSSADPVRHIYTKADLGRLLEAYPCVAVLFTSETCPPCRIVKPEFSSLAHHHHVAEGKPGAYKRIAFAQVDSGSATQTLMQSCSISATPTVSCYVNGALNNQVKGANIGELRSSIDLMLFEVYPFHPHMQLRRPVRSFRFIPTTPHAFRAVPNLRSALQKLKSAFAEHPAKNFNDKADSQDARKALTGVVIPILETSFDADGQVPVAKGSRYEARHLEALDQATTAALRLLPVEQVFPLIDMVRLALLVDDFAAGLLFGIYDARKPGGGPLVVILTKVQQLASDGDWEAKRRPTYLTTARLLGNLTVSGRFMDAVEHHQPLKQAVLDLITSLLLCPDAGVRSSAATSSFNIALHEHKLRPEWINRDPAAPSTLGSRMGEEWETEMASALAQAITNEGESDETLHRLCASLLLTVHLSQFWQEHLAPLLEVLEAGQAFKAKVESDVVTASKKKEELSGLLLDLQALCASP